ATTAWPPRSRSPAPTARTQNRIPSKRSFRIPSEVEAAFRLESQRCLDDLAARLFDVALLRLGEELEVVLQQLRGARRQTREDGVEHRLGRALEGEGEPVGLDLTEQVAHRLRLDALQVFEREHRLLHVRGEAGVGGRQLVQDGGGSRTSCSIQE